MRAWPCLARSARFGTGLATAAWTLLPTGVAAQSASGAVEAVFERASSPAEVHLARGNAYVADWRLTEAREELEAAIRLNPNMAAAHQALARVLEIDGRLEEALVTYRRAAALDPRSSQIADQGARALFLASRYAEAQAWAERAIALQPGNAEARHWRAWALMELNRLPEAVEEVRRLPFGTEPLNPVFASAVYYRAGLRREGDEAFRQIPATVRTSVPYLVALKSRRDDIIALMAPSIARPAEAPLLFYLSAFDSIRSHPRFREIIREAGAGAAYTRAQAERARWRDEAAQRAHGGAQGSAAARRSDG